MLEAILLWALSVTGSSAPPDAPFQDTIREVRTAARAAAFQYETLLRRRAPQRLGGASASECDEVIGRFCFTFDDGDEPDEPPAPEHPSMGEARRLAVEAHRRWLSAEPSSSEAAGALVRYLVEEGGAGQAVSIARTHAWAAGRTPESLLVLGLALHYDGRFEAAEAAFDTALAGVPAGRRAEMTSVEMLLEPRERGRYRRLSAEERAAYDRRLWAFSDPSLLVPGHERRSAHLARHAWALVLERAPSAPGRVSWGWDQEEILLRYGRPVGRERVSRPAWQIDQRLSMVETFDPRALSFVPGALVTEGLPRTPDPGLAGALARSAPRSSYTPVLHPATRPMAVVVTRIPLPDSDGAILRLDAALPPDTAEPAVPESPRGLVVIRDTLGHELVRRAVQPHVRPDSVTELSAEVPLPPGAYVYQLEVVDDSTRLAGLARYRVDLEEPESLRVSDPMIAALPEGPIPERRADLVASSDGIVPPAPFLLWTEVRGLGMDRGPARYEVEWWLESAERENPAAAALRWLGRRLGLVGPDRAVRVRWEESAAADSARIAFSVDASSLDTGLYRIHLAIRDRVSGRESAVSRAFRVEPRAAGPGTSRSPR